MTVDPFFNDRGTIGVFERSFYAGREAAEEIEAILEWRARPRRVLDIGCNAGLHALEWARRGVEVVGIDSAPVAIAVARERAAGNPRVRFEVADLADPDLGRLGTFDLVTVLGGVFNCIPRAALLPAFGAIRSALEPGGDLVFDVLRWRDTPRTVFLRRDGQGALRIVWEFTLDPVEGRGHVVGQFLETGAIQDSERNFYTAPEVTTLLDLAGFERLAVAGDLALAVPAREAEPSFFFRARSR
ncbi:MAG TPA: class I SAM-dependent methyltransferase [Methylomirabilota bacterium]|nr:class I SAM-dependent methyltransferase [Methylomirabilota bacterium]